MSYVLSMEQNQHIEINPQFKAALELIENSKRNLLLLGKAGTGKSTFLNYLRKNTKKNIAVLAPTGVAAINIQGMTIHSFFGFSIDITLEKVKKYSKNHRSRKILKNLDAIVIDEISMVRADILDCINKFLMLNSPKSNQVFGGIQMVFIGDLYQIPPIVKNDLKHFFTNHYQSPYFFSANIFQEQGENFELIEFEKIYRQKDNNFVAILNAIRNNTVDNTHLTILNQRLQPDFKPKKEELWLYITGTNSAVKQINDTQLALIPKQEKTYFATINGQVNQDSFPTDAELKIKVGAQVMLVSNDSDGRWVNGSLGQVTAILSGLKDQPDTITVKLTSGATVHILPEAWDVFKYDFDEEAKALTTSKIGSFTQYPLRLAWALTVHKSQGKTFDNIIVDLGVTFTPGQMYVALSRCTSIQGLVLKKKVTPSNIFIDRRIVNFITGFQYQKADKAMPLNDKVILIKTAIENKQSVDITYLKAKDEKTTRRITPTFVGTMEYQGKQFIGVSGLCALRNEVRTFRVDRVLTVTAIKN